MCKTAFIGHRRIRQNNLAEELDLTIERQIQLGCTHFIVGSHGQFDRLALSAVVHYENNTLSWSLKS